MGALVLLREALQRILWSHDEPQLSTGSIRLNPEFGVGLILRGTLRCRRREYPKSSARRSGEAKPWNNQLARAILWVKPTLCRVEKLHGYLKAHELSFPNRRGWPAKRATRSARQLKRVRGHSS